MTIIWYMVPEISTATDRFFLSSWTICCPFTPLTARKIKISEKWKKHLEISSFYTIAPKLMIIGYTVREIWCVMDVIVFFIVDIFCTFTPLKAQKTKISKKKKKHLEMSKFYTSVPKILIICCTVLEIWHMTYVVVVFHFGHFFALLPP